MQSKFKAIIIGLSGLLFGGVMITTLNSCGGNSAKYVPATATNELMEEYMEAQVADNDLNDGVNAYFDFSNGLDWAYRINNNKSCLRDIVNQLRDDETDFFKLANGEITEIEGDKEAVFNTITNPASYRNTAAPIRKALDAIANGGKPALLVTDYEEYDGKTIHKSAYARSYFTDWVKNGGDITFLIMDYKEGGKAKKIFFTVFDGGEHKLLNAVKSALGTDSEYKTFTIGRNAIDFTAQYPGNHKGGNFHNADGNDLISFVVEDPTTNRHFFRSDDVNAEFYPIDGLQGFNEIGVNTMDEAFAGEFKNLFGNLYADFSRFPYRDVELGLKVYDVQGDFEEFVMAEQNDTTYTPDASRLIEIPNLLALSKEINATDLGREIAINFSDDYTPDADPLTDLVRVDVVVKSVKDLTKEDLEPLFKWGDNDNLSESIRLSLQDLRPAGETIYSYYIQIQ